MQEETKNKYKKKVVGNFNKGQPVNGSSNLRFTMTQPLSKAMLLGVNNETNEENENDNNQNNEHHENKPPTIYTKKQQDIKEPKPDVQTNVIKSIKLLLNTLDEKGLNEIQNEINKLKKKK